jgi:hypothetical protein
VGRLVERNVLRSDLHTSTNATKPPARKETNKHMVVKKTMATPNLSLLPLHLTAHAVINLDITCRKVAAWPPGDDATEPTFLQRDLCVGRFVSIFPVCCDQRRLAALNGPLVSVSEDGIGVPAGWRSQASLVSAGVSLSGHCATGC